MTRKKAIIAVVAVLGFGQSPQRGGQQPHKRLEWTGACVVDIMHTPCRTVRYHERRLGPGLYNLGLMTSDFIEAVDRDGSESNTRRAAWRRLYLFPLQTWNVTELMLKAQHRTVYIDPVRGTYESHDGFRHGWHGYWEEDDTLCSYTKALYGPFSTRLPGATIAGFPAIGYRGKDEKGTDYEAYFAPSVGCQMMLFREIAHGTFGLPTSLYERIVDSYDIGPPDRSLFAIPNGYKQVESITP